MGSSLEDSMSTTTRNRVDTLHDETLSYWYWCNAKIFNFLRIIMGCICNSTFENIIDDLCTFLWHKSECIESLLSFHVSHDVCDNIKFLWRDANISDWSFHKRENFRVYWLIYNLLLITRVSTEDTSKRKLTELMSNHIFCNKYRNMRLTIVNTECMTYEFRSNSTRARPCLDNSLFSWSIQCFYLLHYAKINVRSFFETTSHRGRKLDCRLQEEKLTLEFSWTSSENPSISTLARTSLHTASETTPWSLWTLSLSNWLVSFTSSMWMVYRVHRWTENRRTTTHPSWTTSFTDSNLVVINIWNNSDSRTTLLMNKTDFSTWHLELSILTFLWNNLSVCTSWTNRRSTLSNNHFNIMNKKSCWDKSNLHTVSSNRFCRIWGNYLISYLCFSMSKNISSFTIFVAYKSDKCCSIWIILNCFNSSRNIDFIKFEVNYTIKFLMTSTLMTNWYTTSTIATCMSLDRNSKWLIWFICCKFFVCKPCHETTRGSGRFILLDWHREKISEIRESLLFCSFKVCYLLSILESNHSFLLNSTTTSNTSTSIMEFWTSMKNIYLLYINTVDSLKCIFYINLCCIHVNHTCIDASDFSIGTFVGNNKFFDDIIERVHRENFRF